MPQHAALLSDFCPSPSPCSEGAQGVEPRSVLDSREGWMAGACAALLHRILLQRPQHARALHHIARGRARPAGLPSVPSAPMEQGRPLGQLGRALGRLPQCLFYRRSSMVAAVGERKQGSHARRLSLARHCVRRRGRGLGRPRLGLLQPIPGDGDDEAADIPAEGAIVLEPPQQQEQQPGHDFLLALSDGVRLKP